MRVVITGAGGFLGRRLARELLRRDGGAVAITELVAADLTAPRGWDDPRVEAVGGDLADPGVAARLTRPGTDAVFHLAAAVSGAAEADFDLGMRANVDGTRALLEACRALDDPPRIVFSSTVAVYGGALPPVVSEATAPTPETSYGAEKVIGEMLVADYTRRGFVDGRVVRLPTITVRGDAPNAAVTSFASSIVREPVRGREAVCPVPPETELWVLSPRRVTAALLHAMELPADAWNRGRIVALPGSRVTAGALVDALRHLAGDDVADRVRWQVDSYLAGLVSGFPVAFDTSYAAALGFVGDPDAAAIVTAFLEEEAAPADG